MSTSETRPFPFLDLPKEIRLDIYEWYMLDHVNSSMSARHVLDNLVDPNLEDLLCCNHVLCFESPHSHTPALTRVCKQIAQEFAPIAGQLVSFTFGGKHVFGFDDSGKPYPHTEPALPLRVRPSCKIRHLHFEWKHDRDSFKVFYAPEALPLLDLPFPHIENAIARCGMGNGFSTIETIRITSIPPFEVFRIIGKYSNHARLLATVESAMESLIEISLSFPNLRRIEFIGIFTVAWLDKVEKIQHNRKGGSVKVLRGEPSFPKKMDPANRLKPPTIELCYGVGLTASDTSQLFTKE